MRAPAFLRPRPPQGGGPARGPAVRRYPRGSRRDHPLARRRDRAHARRRRASHRPQGRACWYLGDVFRKQKTRRGDARRARASKGGCGGPQTTRIIDLAGALVGSNPGRDANHFVLRFRLSFRSPGKWLRGHDTNHFVLRFRLSFRSPGKWLRGLATTYTEHISSGGGVRQKAKSGARNRLTRLSCHSFRNNEVRLQLHALAYNLGNFLRTLALPEAVEHWSPTHSAEQAHQDRRKGRATWPLRHIPARRGRYPQISVPRSCA